MKVPKEIIITKILSTLLLFIAVIISMSITTGFKINNQESAFSFILAFASILIALTGIWIKKVKFDSFVRAVLIIVSAGLLLSSFFFTVTIKPTALFPLVNDSARFMECLFFTIMFIAFIEIAHASVRFSTIIEKTASNKDFRISSLFKLYFSFFYAPIGIAIAIALFVLNANILLKLALPLQFAESVEFNSIYGVAMVSTLVFVPLGLAVAFLFRKDVFIQARPDKAAISENTQKEITKSKTPSVAAKSQAKGAQEQKASKKQHSDK